MRVHEMIACVPLVMPGLPAPASFRKNVFDGEVRRILHELGDKQNRRVTRSDLPNLNLFRMMMESEPQEQITERSLAPFVFVKIDGIQNLEQVFFVFLLRGQLPQIEEIRSHGNGGTKLRGVNDGYKVVIEFIRKATNLR